MKRYGIVTGLRAEKVHEYKQRHAAVWLDVLKMIKQCHIQNYSIYLRQLDDGQYYLQIWGQYLIFNILPLRADFSYLSSLLLSRSTPLNSASSVMR